MRANEKMINWQELQPLVDQLHEASQAFDVVRLRKLLQRVVSGYKPDTDIHDLLWNRVRVEK